MNSKHYRRLAELTMIAAAIWSMSVPDATAQSATLEVRQPVAAYLPWSDDQDVLLGSTIDDQPVEVRRYSRKYNLFYEVRWGDFLVDIVNTGNVVEQRLYRRLTDALDPTLDRYVRIPFVGTQAKGAYGRAFEQAGLRVERLTATAVSGNSDGPYAKGIRIGDLVITTVVTLVYNHTAKFKHELQEQVRIWKPSAIHLPGLSIKPLGRNKVETGSAAKDPRQVYLDHYRIPLDGEARRLYWSAPALPRFDPKDHPSQRLKDVEVFARALRTHYQTAAEVSLFDFTDDYLDQPRELQSLAVFVHDLLAGSRDKRMIEVSPASWTAGTTAVEHHRNRVNVTLAWHGSTYRPITGKVWRSICRR